MLKTGLPLRPTTLSNSGFSNIPKPRRSVGSWLGDVSSTISNRQNFGAITVSVISVGAFSTPLTCNASPTLLVVIVLSSIRYGIGPSTLQEGRQNEGTAGGGGGYGCARPCQTATALDP